jgi:hypothetical protein
MKRIILGAILLASLSAGQAGDAKIVPAKDNDTPSCCADKVKTSYETKGTCSATSGSCCKAAPKVKQTALLSPKAADSKAKSRAF